MGKRLLIDQVNDLEKRVKNLEKSSPEKEICECHKPGFSCTGCELGTECESMVHFERIKPSKSKESWEEDFESQYGVYFPMRSTKNSVKAFISDLLLKQREEDTKTAFKTGMEVGIYKALGQANQVLLTIRHDETKRSKYKLGALAILDLKERIDDILKGLKKGNDE